jgi:hypothetical protein
VFDSPPGDNGQKNTIHDEDKYVTISKHLTLPGQAERSAALADKAMDQYLQMDINQFFLLHTWGYNETSQTFFHLLSIYPSHR